MNALSLRPPIERFARSPELASLTILESVLATCEAALAACLQVLGREERRLVREQGRARGFPF